MTNPFKIAVLASTNGTDLQAIIDEMEAGKMPGVELSVVLSNKKCFALERAKDQGFETHYIDPTGKSREMFDKEMAEILDEKGVDLIVLVGYMRILSEWFVGHFERKIINVHPSLIPKFCGEGFFGSNVHNAVLEAGEKETGMTIFVVDEGCDTGEIILQKKCDIEESDTADDLKDKVQVLEKKWYPEAIRMFQRSEIK